MNRFRDLRRVLVLAVLTAWCLPTAVTLATGGLLEDTGHAEGRPAAHADAHAGHGIEGGHAHAHGPSASGHSHAGSGEPASRRGGVSTFVEGRGTEERPVERPVRDASALALVRSLAHGHSHGSTEPDHEHTALRAPASSSPLTPPLALGVGLAAPEPHRPGRLRSHPARGPRAPPSTPRFVTLCTYLL